MAPATQNLEVNQPFTSQPDVVAMVNLKQSSFPAQLATVAGRVEGACTRPAPMFREEVFAVVLGSSASLALMGSTVTVRPKRVLGPEGKLSMCHHAQWASPQIVESVG